MLKGNGLPFGARKGSQFPDQLGVDAAGFQDLADSAVLIPHVGQLVFAGTKTDAGNPHGNRGDSIGAKIPKIKTFRLLTPHLAKSFV